LGFQRTSRICDADPARQTQTVSGVDLGGLPIMAGSLTHIQTQIQNRKGDRRFLTALNGPRFHADKLG
jgi:hypothetical protein